MDNVIQFPTAPARNWRELEDEIRGYLWSCGASSGMTAWVVDRMKSIYMATHETVEIPIFADPPEHVQMLENMFKKANAALFVELIYAHVRIYRLEHGG